MRQSIHSGGTERVLYSTLGEEVCVYTHTQRREACSTYIWYVRSKSVYVGIHRVGQEYEYMMQAGAAL